MAIRDQVGKPKHSKHNGLIPLILILMYPVPEQSEKQYRSEGKHDREIQRPDKGLAIQRVKYGRDPCPYDVEDDARIVQSSEVLEGVCVRGNTYLVTWGRTGGRRR